MSSMQAIKTAVESLKKNNVTQDEKLRIYSVLRDTFGTLYKQKVTIEDDDTISCLFVCANSDVTSENSSLQQAVLLLLDLLFKCKCRNLLLDDIPDAYIKIAFSDVTEDGSDIREAALNCVRSCLQELIIQNKLDPEKLLLNVDDSVSRKKISELMQRTSTEIPAQQYLIFFYERMIPRMFDTFSIDVRASLVEDVLKLLPRFSIALLSNEKLETFKGKVKASYVDRVIELRVLKDPNWHHLWIFLSRCCGKILHVQVDIMNSLLKAVESAFRSSAIEDRLAAYECWKELIDNYSLDIERMCHPKQMKLIVTPLKTNVSKNDLVTYKRFEIWTHLISVLKQRAFVCVEPFLVFCFGPLGENPFIAVENPDIRSPGRKVAQLWQGTTRALLEIIGHYGHDAEHPCMEQTSCTVIKLDQPIINSSNFTSLDYKIINSVGECSVLMLQWMDTHTLKKVIKCLWGSLLNIIKQLKGKQQEVAIERVTLQLVMYIQTSKEKPEYFEYLLKPVLDVLLLEQFFPIEVYNKMFLFPLIKCFLKHTDTLFLSGRKIILDLVSYGKNTDCKSSWFKQAYSVFIKVEVRKNLNNLVLFWIECADVLIHLCRNTTEQSTEIIQTTGLQFMMWPMPYIQKITLKKISNELLDKWGITFEQIHKSYAKESLIVMLDLQTTVKETPSIASSVATLFRCFGSMLNTDSNDKLVATVLNLAFDLLALPNLNKDDASSLLPVVIILMNITAQKPGDAVKDATFRDLCQCCKCLLQPHEHLKILDPLESFFEKIPSNLKENVPESLLTVITNLKTHRDDTVAGKATKVLNKLSVSSKVKLDKAFLPPKMVQSSRGAKITLMARATSTKEMGSPKESTVRLFGQNLGSPANVRGSQMGSISQSKAQKRRAANSFKNFSKNPVVDDGDDANYVLIDSPYQFDPEKLSEHQLESMKRRRSDIPALYQDLSQSQSSSQGLFQAAAKESSDETQKEAVSPQNLFSEEHSYTKILENDKNGANKASNDWTVSKTAEELPSEHSSTKNSMEIKRAMDITIFPILEAPGLENGVKDDSATTSSFIKTTKQENSDKTVSGNESKENEKADHSLKEAFSSCANLPFSPIQKVLSPQTSKPASTDTKSASTEVIPVQNNNNNDTSMPTRRIQSRKSLTDDQSNDFDLKVNLQVKNPSREQIEAIITDDSLQAKEPARASSSEGVNKDKLASDVGEEGEHGSGVEKDLKRLTRVQKELNKIKMDIVGGDVFVQNLDLSDSKIQTRRRGDLSFKNLRLRSSSKINYDSDDSKGSSDSIRRTKPRATLAIVDKAKDRRTLSPRSNKRGELSPGKTKLSNGDVKSPTRCKLADRFDKSEAPPVDSNMAVGSSEAISTRRGVRRSILNEEDSQDKQNPDRKKRKVRKCIADILEIPPYKTIEAEKDKLTKPKGIETKEAVNADPNRVTNETKGKVDADESLNNKETHRNKKKPKSNSQIEDIKSKNETDLANENSDCSQVSKNLASQNSEDVIESSQESYVEINPRQNYSKLDNSATSKKKAEPPTNTRNPDLDLLNSEIQQIVKGLSRKMQKTSLDNSNSPTIADPIAALPQEKESDDNSERPSNQDVESLKSLEDVIGVCSPDELMRIDLTSRISDLSSEEKNTCEMDTQTQELLTPKKLVTIPSSPICADTPTRTCELIDSTVNISPIKPAAKSKCSNEDNTEKTPDLFDSEACIPKTDLQVAENPPEIKNNEMLEVLPEDQLEKPLEPVLETERKSEAISINLSSLSNPSSRSAKLLNLISCTPSPKRTKKLLVSNPSKIRPNILVSTKGHRTMKMMQKCEETLEFEDAPKGPNVEVVQVEDSDEESKGCIPEKDLLQFVRELPGPTASPKCSILKRRRTPEMTDEGLSPPRKQKRVNFSDPPMTCQKVFIQDENEHVRYTAAKKVKEVEPLPSHLRINFPSFNISHSNSDDVQTVHSVAQDAVVMPPEAACSDIDTESLSMQTQGSVDTTDAHLLDRGQPIYPDLVDCKENIHIILTSITNPMYVPALLEELQTKKLFTVGDLAKLSEVEVNRLPLKIPKITTVRRALTEFCNRILFGANMNVVNANNDRQEKTIENATVMTADLEAQKPLMQLSQSSEEKLTGLFEDDQPKVKEETDQPPNVAKNMIKSNSPDAIVPPPAAVVPKLSHNTEELRQFTSPSLKKIIRRIPLKPATGAGSPSSNMFKQAKVIDCSVVTQTHTVVSNKTKSNSSGAMQERKKLQGVMSDLIADFKNLQNKAIKQDLKVSSLYETIIEIVGPDVFVSILQDNKSLCLTHFVKNNDWTELFREVVDSIGVRKFIFWLSRIPKVSPLNLVDGIFEQLATQDANIKKIAVHIMETVSLTLILNQFGVRRIVSELHQMCQNSSFSAEEFFQLTTFTFSPSIEEILPSFRHINVVQLEGKTVQRTNSTERDLSNFIERILTLVEKPKLPTIFPKDKMLVLYDSKELTEGILGFSSNEDILESCVTLLQRLPKAKLKEDTYQSVAHCLFSKIPFGDLWRYFSNHVNSCQEMPQNND